MGDYFNPIVLKTERENCYFFLFKVRLKGREKLGWGFVGLWGGIFWNETSSLDVILYAIHGTKRG